MARVPKSISSREGQFQLSRAARSDVHLSANAKGLALCLAFFVHKESTGTFTLQLHNTALPVRLLAQ
jgi:hypothetical protein